MPHLLDPQDPPGLSAQEGPASGLPGSSMTAESVLAAALNDLWQRGWLNIPDGYSPEVAVTQFLAAMPDWTLVPRVATADWTGSTKHAEKGETP